ncbi:MAG: hypothetical protein ACLTML_00295 [Blautia faecis]
MLLTKTESTYNKPAKRKLKTFQQVYLSVPLGYRMWQKKESKLELAVSMIRQVMPEFHSKDHVIILCDSWYTLPLS